MKEITLAIFPFENLADGKTTDFYCKSLYLDLVTELSRFRQFRIMAKDSLPAEIGSDGGSLYQAPDYVIKGSFRAKDDGVRINAQLLKPESNQIVWADHFEGNMQSVLMIQQVLLEQIAASLQQQLNYDLLSHIRKNAKTNASAYEYWLYGMEELKNGSVEADEKARQYFTKAMEIEPSYSLAYSGMSLSFFNEWSCQLWERWDVSRKGAFEWAQKAIELDSQNYIAALVLGRVHLYEANYELSEHYLRRALRLNPNDIDCLIQAASGLVFLGYADEAETLYQRVIQLNPINADNYRHIGAFIALERGDFTKSIEKGRYVTCPWLDFDAFLAAAYYHAGDLHNMDICWNKFAEKFQTRIIKSAAYDLHEAVQWLHIVNPFKGQNRLFSFLQYLDGRNPETKEVVSFVNTPASDSKNFLIRKKGLWEIVFHGRSSLVIEVKGLYDLAKLLQNPEKEFHCTELMGAGLYAEGEPVFDEKAKKAYRKKLQEMKEEIDDLDERNDVEQKASLQAEYDSLLKHLSTSLGLGGKSRKTNDPVDKVRSAVTWRIRKAIRTIENENPALARHLSLSVKTGLFCAYRPESGHHWEVEC